MRSSVGLLFFRRFFLLILSAVVVLLLFFRLLFDVLNGDAAIEPRQKGADEGILENAANRGPDVHVGLFEVAGNGNFGREPVLGLIFENLGDAGDDGFPEFSRMFLPRSFCQSKTSRFSKSGLI